uniref:Uncharacterized protein n=1 Tax=Romanomermis culicivorax TaxID=13658 RepID=A0A915JM08_ROMCU
MRAFCGPMHPFFINIVWALKRREIRQRSYFLLEHFTVNMKQLLVSLCVSLMVWNSDEQISTLYYEWNEINHDFIPESVLKMTLCFVKFHYDNCFIDLISQSIHRFPTNQTFWEANFRKTEKYTASTRKR